MQAQVKEAGQDKWTSGYGAKAEGQGVSSLKGMIEDLKNEPVWSSYLDPEDGTTVLFYNRLTKESITEKPADYDGFYVVGESAVNQKKDSSKQLYDKTFGDIGKMFTTPLELANVPLPTKDG